jgi:L-gulono-1,4-lactone dehydrogenase
MAGLPAWRNWAGNQRAQPSAGVRPETVEALVAAVRVAAERGQRVKAVGSGHSCSALAATTGMAIRLERLQRLLDVDLERREVTVEAGITLRRLAWDLVGFGLAVDHPGELGDQTVGGALATGTHGSSAGGGGLASTVVALQVVTADGRVRQCRADADAGLFAAARVGLGAVGILATVTLRCVRAGSLRVVERPRSLDELEATFDEEACAHDQFQAWWFLHPRRGRTQAADRGTDQPAGRTPKEARRDRRRPMETPARGARAFVVRSEQALVHTPRAPVVETEWALPRAALLPAFRELAAGRAGPPPAGALPIRLRVGAADDAWLSPAAGRDTGYLSCRSPAGGDYRGWFAAVSAILAAHDGRPHWATLHPLDHQALAVRYPEWERFNAVRARVDPDGVFTNPELDRLLGRPGG